MMSRHINDEREEARLNMMHRKRVTRHRISHNNTPDEYAQEEDSRDDNDDVTSTLKRIADLTKELSTQLS